MSHRRRLAMRSRLACLRHSMRMAYLRRHGRDVEGYFPAFDRSMPTSPSSYGPGDKY